MTTKQRSDSKILITKNRQKLSPIGKELLNHCKNRQPVFLYGEYKDRKNLFRDVHVANGGKDQRVEYFDDKGNSISWEAFCDNKYKVLGIGKKDILDAEGFLRTTEYYNRHSRITENTWESVDCGAMSAKEVYIELVIDAEIIGAAEFDKESKTLLDKYMNMDIGRINEQELKSLRNNNHNDPFSAISNLQDRLNGKITEVEPEPVYKGYLFRQKGSLLIDNLPKPMSSEDEKCYRSLAKIIRARELGYSFTTFNWLVVYTHDNPKDFDKYFLEPFALISLDGKEAVVEPVAETAESKEQQGEVVEQSKDSVSLNIFRYKGGHWEITFDGKTIFPKDKEGFYYISYVLSNPKANLHNYRIYQKVKGLENGKVTEDQKFEEELYSEDGSTKVKTTEEDKGRDYQDYEVMVAALDKEDEELREEKEELEIDNVDVSRLEEIEEKLSQNSETRKLIIKDFKSGGKNKPEKEKTIYNVYKNINRSLQTIKKEHPSLHAHFEAFFTNDKEFTFYNITPEMNILWQTNHS